MDRKNFQYQRQYSPLQFLEHTLHMKGTVMYYIINVTLFVLHGIGPVQWLIFVIQICLQLIQIM